MAGSVNKVIILGNLGQNPEVKYLPSGQAVCEMRIATSETYKDRNEQPQERTEWHRVVVWGKTGENCGKYLQKGQKVYIEGRIQTRSWDDKEGKKQYMTEVVANQVVFLGGGRGGEDSPRSGGGGGGDRGGYEDQGQAPRRSYGRSSDSPPPPPPPMGGSDMGGPADFGDDDIPF